MALEGRQRSRGSKIEQETVRRLAFEALMKGKSVGDVADMFSLSHSIVYQWSRKLKGKGKVKAKEVARQLAFSKQRGRKTGEKRRLTSQEERKLKRWIVDGTPDQMKLPFMLWERKAVAALVKRKFEVDLPVSTVGEYMRRWGLTSQRPATSYYEKQPAAVKKWLDEEYPAIAKQAKEEDAEIQWADEAGPTSNSAAGIRGYAPIGETPVLKRKARAERINYICSVSNQGKARYLIYKSNFTAEVFIKFLEQSIKGAAGRKIIMIVDNLRVHHSVAVKQWLVGKEHLIELRFLPAYSPELNPTEYLNHDMKANVHRHGMPRKSKDLERNVRDHLKRIASSKKRVRSYFQAKHVRYAA